MHLLNGENEMRMEKKEEEEGREDWQAGVIDRKGNRVNKTRKLAFAGGRQERMCVKRKE